MRNTNESSLSELVTKLLDTYRLNNGLNAVRVREAWAHCMQPAIIHRTVALYFTGGILTVKLNSAVVRHELQTEKAKLMQLLNEQLGSEVITDIIFS